MNKINKIQKKREEIKRVEESHIVGLITDSEYLEYIDKLYGELSNLMLDKVQAGASKGFKSIKFKG